MSYCLFLSVTLMLFLRPGDLSPSLAEIPFYEWLFIGSMLTSLAPMMTQLRVASVCSRPVTACILGICGAVTLSEVPFAISSALAAAVAFSKNVLYYLVLVAQVNTPQRLRHYLAFLTLCILLLGLLPVLQEQGVINLESLVAIQQGETDLATGDRYYIPRMQATGIFNDPNDLAIITAVGMLLCGHVVLSSTNGAARLAGLIGIIFLYYVLYQTRSRGGMLALLAGVMAYGTARFGWRRAAPCLGLCLPLLLVLSAGRMTDLSVTEGTGQQRIRLWSEGMAMLQGAPLFGIGYGRYADHAGLQAHNSFVNSYAELGFVGGTCFFGAFASPVAMLFRMKAAATSAMESDLERFRPLLLAITVSYICGMLSLSRAYVIPTYLVCGINTAWLTLEHADVKCPAFCVTAQFAQRLAISSTVFVVAIYVYIRLFAVWN